MKKPFTLISFALMIGSLFGQQKGVEVNMKNFNAKIESFGPSKGMETKMKTYSRKIDSIVTSEKLLMNQELDVVDKNFETGKINAEEKLAQKKSIALKFESSINEKVKKESEALQELTKELAAQSLFHKNNSPTEITHDIKVMGKTIGTVTLNNKTNPPKKMTKSSDLSISYGFMNLTADSGSFDPFDRTSQMRIGNSHSFEIQSRKTRQLGGYDSPFFIRYGLAYRSDTYMPKRPLIFVQNNEQLYLDTFANGTLKRSKLRNVYLTLPVDFQWVLNPQYTEYEGVKYLDAHKKQFKVGVGAYAGVNLRNIIKVKYYDREGDFEKYKDVLNYGVNPFLFGARFNVSYGGLHFFIKKDFTPIFDSQTVLPNKYGIQVGVELLNFDF